MSSCYSAIRQAWRLRSLSQKQATGVEDATGTGEEEAGGAPTLTDCGRVTHRRLGESGECEETQSAENQEYFFHKQFN